MALQRIHHVAYRCKDALETVKWYEKYMGMTYQLAFAENQVPSTKEPDPYMHVFLDAGNENGDLSELQSVWGKKNVTFFRLLVGSLYRSIVSSHRRLPTDWFHLIFRAARLDKAWHRPALVR